LKDLENIDANLNMMQSQEAATYFKIPSSPKIKA
jgi:hypothetical protein